MSVTDELREYADKAIHRDDYMAGLAFDLNRIADRIDEAVASEYVRLPKDADGVPIHIGDEVDTEHFGTVEVEGFVHHSVAFYNYSEQPAYLCTTPASLCRHHREPTVEDVLREMCLEIDRRLERGGIDYDELFAEYAEKLREVVEHDRN